MFERRKQKLVVVSNRLPVILHDGDGSWDVKSGGGGLVQALDPVLRERGGLWVGWPGVSGIEKEAWEPLLEAEGRARGYRFAPVVLEEDIFRGFYAGFSNAVLWPMFHNLDQHCVFDPSFWDSYVTANARFAEEIDREVDGDFVWVHDYQLILVGEELKRRDRYRELGFFLHIPFPPLESFLKLPWRAEVLNALLAYDIIGFQTERDRRSFLDCVQRLLPNADVAEVERDENMPLVEVRHDGGITRVGTFPIGVDFGNIVETAGRHDVEERLADLRHELGRFEVILGVDRLDYTKGIPERLMAFRSLLERVPELRERVVLLQVVEPSRERVPEYQELKVQIDRLVGAINGQFSTAGWVPVHYLYRSVGQRELFAMYRLARVALVTPLKDGMNLVAKEYCACRLDEDGALVLSEFAGAAAQLHADAFIVNPYDVDGTAESLKQALELDPASRRRRMRALRTNIAEEDVFWWTRRFLEAARADGVFAIPPISEYVPELNQRSR